MALSAVSLCKDAPCANDTAGLRAFLRSRCGSLKGAFAELDTHDVGRLTSDDFVKGLQRLGYTEDASAFFRSMDSSKTGVLTLKSFMNCLGDRVFDTDVDRQSPTMSRSSSEDAWKSARIPKTPSSTPNLLTSVQVGNVLKSGSALRSSTPENSGLTSPKAPGADLSSTPNLLTSVPVGNVLKSGSALRSSTPENSGLASPHLPVAGADLLYARVSRVEEKVAAEQRLRCETEQRLTQHLNSLVGVSISEQLDVLREQLVEERMQRQVEISAVRATIETIRSGSALRSSTSTPDNSSSHLPVAGADLLYGRMSRVEEQFATEQRLRSETEQRLTQHLNSLVGVIISEQVDILREQLVEERMQRQVESSALRTTIETVRSMALRSVQENLEECVKSEVHRSMSEMRLSVGQSQVKKYPEEIAQKLDELGKSMEGRVSELEQSTASRASCAVRSEMQKMKQELDTAARKAADTSAANLAELDHRFHLLEEKLRVIEPQARSARDAEAQATSAQVQRQTTGPMPTSPPMGANMVRSRSVAMARGVEPGPAGSLAVKVAASPPVPGAPGAGAGYPRNVRMVPAPQTQRPVSPTPASPQMQRSAPPPLESPYVHSRAERLPASSMLANQRRR